MHSDTHSVDAAPTDEVKQRQMIYAIMSYFKELAWNFIGATEKNDVSLQSDEPDRRVRSNGVFPEREAEALQL